MPLLGIAWACLGRATLTPVSCLCVAWALGRLWQGGGSVALAKCLSLILSQFTGRYRRRVEGMDDGDWCQRPTTFIVYDLKDLNFA